jgi:hypothetical protein
MMIMVIVMIDQLFDNKGGQQKEANRKWGWLALCHQSLHVQTTPLLVTNEWKAQQVLQMR